MEVLGDIWMIGFLITLAISMWAGTKMVDPVSGVLGWFIPVMGTLVAGLFIWPVFLIMFLFYWEE